MTSADILMSYNIRPSLTRVMIFDYLRNNRTHPTADEIFSALHPKAPTLSKTTVYNTVKLLSSEGVIKMITIEEKQARFDACADNHGHFLCIDCGKVYDFDITFPEDNLPEKFDVSTKDIYFTGKCSKCSKK